MKVVGHMRVYMVVVRHGLVPASWSRYVTSFVPRATMAGGAAARILA
jgi:hypothetical protein